MLDDNKQQLMPEDYTIPASAEELQSPPMWATGSAKSEERQWDDLERLKRENDKRWLTHYGWMVIGIGWVFAVIFLSSLLSWTWHYVGPEYVAGHRLHWLDAEKLSKIQSLLFSGGMGAIVSGIIRSQLGKAH